MATVLITQCLQRDFVDPISPHDPLPNLLHVGHREATRLLGPEPSAGPLAQLIDWAHSLAPDAIDLVHIRDWHDPGDPAQREHLQRFGAHCIKGSHGARLVLGMDERAGAASNEVIVDSLTLNDLEGTDLVQQLERIRQAHGAPLRVGVVGVWTEAKVSGGHRCRPGGARTACARDHHPRGLGGDVRICHFRGALRLSPP